jgi:hypothetical protein
VVDALKSSSDELKFLAFEELKGKEPIKGLEADPSAFVRWAEKAGYDMTCHPLHFLFLDQKTNAARMGWKAAVEHYNPQPAQPKAEKQEQGEPVAIIEELIPNTDCELRAVRWLDVEASFKYPIGTLLAPFKNIKEK